MSHYIDASAAVKLVVEEVETDALRRWIQDIEGQLITSDLTRTELIRATRRVVPDRLGRAHDVLDALEIVGLPSKLFRQAGLIEPRSLRSLDAIHLAAALELGDELDGIVTYDDRLADAANQLGIPVVAPA
jgi:hypothetical protein